VRICKAGDQLPVPVSTESATQSRALKHTLQDIQTYTTQPVDVGVVDLREKADLRRRHGIVIWEEELELEGSTWSSDQFRNPR